MKIILITCSIFLLSVNAASQVAPEPQQLDKELKEAKQKVDKLAEEKRKGDAGQPANKSEAEAREAAAREKAAALAGTLAEKNRLIVAQSITIAEMDEALSKQKEAILKLDEAVKNLIAENAAIRKNIKRRSLRRLLPF